MEFLPALAIGANRPGSDSEVASSTVTEVFAIGTGNCAGLAAAVLLLAGGEPGLEAVVLPNHVALRSTRTGGVYELTEAGRVLSPAEVKVRLQGAETVKAADFPSYYADNLAVRLSGAGRVELAEQLFGMAVAANPVARRIRFNYGTFLLDHGRAEEAIPHLKAAARGRKGLAEADLNLGVALSKVGRTKEAEASFRRCLRRDPKNLMAQENLRRLAGDAQLNSTPVPP